MKKDENLNRFIRDLRDKHKQGYKLDTNGWEDDYDESCNEMLKTIIVQLHKVGKDPFSE